LSLNDPVSAAGYIGVPEGLGDGLGAVELCVVVAPPGLAPLGFCGAPGGTGPGMGGAVGEPAGADCATAIPPVMSPRTASVTAARRVSVYLMSASYARAFRSKRDCSATVQGALLVGVAS
jgi:hypothetical protein